jgi:hypothetical protein
VEVHLHCLNNFMACSGQNLTSFLAVQMYPQTYETHAQIGPKVSQSKNIFLDYMSRCIFLIKVLIIQPDTTVQIQYISLLLYTATCFGSPDKPSSSRSQVRKKKYKGRETPLYSGKNDENIILNNRIIRLN